MMRDARATATEMPQRGDTLLSAPLGVPGDRLTEHQAARWLWFFLALGVLARLVRFSLRFPLWEDEAFLATNLLDRGYGELLGPLECRQICPVLFLWVQLTVVKLFGFSEHTLRLFPLVTGLAELFLFRHLAGRFLKQSALVAAVALFAVAYPCIRYSAEAKPYGTDLFVSLVLMALLVEWWRRPDQRRWLWAMAAWMPLALGLSYPAVFVGGAAVALVGLALIRRQARGAWMPWLACGVTLLGSFAATYYLGARHVSSESYGQMANCYRDGFPPWQQPWRLPLWLLEVHASDLVAYPFGGERGASSATLLLIAVGVGIAIRRRSWPLLAFCLAPLALNLAAAGLGRYPYGQNVKFQLHLAAIFCMLAGLGAAGGAWWLQGRRPFRIAPFWSLLAILACLGLGSMARDVWFPAKSATTQRYRDFARWFWQAAEFDGEAVCLKRDLDRVFSPKTYEWGYAALYLCNQRIYSPRHARGEPPRWDKITSDHPLRCVEYYASDHPYDERAAAAWLAEMGQRYDLVAADRFPVTFFDKRDTSLKLLDYLVVYKFVPKGEGTLRVGRGKPLSELR